MLGEIEHVDLGALIAPRALLIETGTEDLIFPSRRRATRGGAPRRGLRALGVPERLEHDVFEGGHRWNGDRAYPFLDRWL